MMEKLPYGNFKIKKCNKIDGAGFYWIKTHIGQKIYNLLIKGEGLMFYNGGIKNWFWYEEILLTSDKYEVFWKIYDEHNGFYLKEFINELNVIRGRGGIKKKLVKY